MTIFENAHEPSPPREAVRDASGLRRADDKPPAESSLRSRRMITLPTPPIAAPEHSNLDSFLNQFNDRDERLSPCSKQQRDEERNGRDSNEQLSIECSI